MNKHIVFEGAGNSGGLGGGDGGKLRSIREIEDLIAQARPLSFEDWGSERQQNLEKEVYAYLDGILSGWEREAFWNYAKEASVEERLDGAFYVIKGELNWLFEWR